jgi:hypothetical protein
MQLGLQLTWAGVLTVLCLLLHGLGIVAITRLLRLEGQRLESKEVGLGAFLLLSGVALCVFLLHAVEIGIFAAFYVAAGVLSGLGEALYFSASSFSTLGTGDVVLPEAWRLVGATEGVAGFLLLGWSTAFFITDMNLLLRGNVTPGR